MPNSAQHARPVKLLNRFSHRSIAGITFCCLDVISQETLRRRSVKSAGQVMFRLIRLWSPYSPLLSASVAMFAPCRFPYFRLRICSQSWDFAGADWPRPIFFLSQNVSALLSARSHEKGKTGGKAGSSWLRSFLTKPKQLIKFDLIVSNLKSVQVLTQ
jgi:hypothetical protein